MNKIVKNNKGITIISLVVTIIILIILAGISINLTLGENGIITMAIRAKKEQDIVRIKEELEIEKGELAIKEYGKLDVNKYLEQIINNGKITEGDIDRNNEESVNIIVEGKYVFLVEKEEPNNIKIDYIGEPGNLIPKIEVTSISSTSNSITINFNLRYSAKYKLSIKEEGQEYRQEKEEIVSTNQISYTFNNLNQSATYTIKIEAESEKGAKSEKEETIKINTIPTPTIIVEDAGKWTKSKNVTITEASGYTTKYTTDGTMPSASNGTIYNGAFTISNNNTTITAVYLDSTNQIGAGSTNTITKIDKLKPSGTIEAEATTNSIKVTVIATDAIATATDGQSGIKGYYYSKDNGANYTSITTETSYTFTELTQTSDYSIKVKVEDNAGNIEEIDTIGSTDIVPTPTIIVANSDTWTKSKSVTITEASGYTTKYTTDGTMPSASNGTTYSGAFTVSNNNTTITAVYLDSTNQVGAGSTNTITKIDKLKPSGTIEAEATTNSIKVIVTATDAIATATDGQSGIKGYYYSKDNGANYTSITTETSYTFTELTQTSDYSIKVKVEDNAGNIEEIDTIGSTDIVPTPTIIVANSNTWTKSKSVTITEASGYTTKYTTDGTMPSASNGTIYNGAFTVSNNNTTITAVYLDSTNQVGSSATNAITKIDTTAPTNVSLTAGEVSNKTIVLTAGATDGQSGIKSYKFYVDGSLKTTITTSSTSTTYNWTSSFGTHTAYIVVEDNVGKTTTSSTINFSDYTIATKAELEAFRDSVNNDGNTYGGKKITQIANIDLQGSETNQWIPIGNTNTNWYFDGTYDGNNYTISGIYINNSTASRQALFAVLYTNGTIKDLKVSGSIIGNAYVAGISGTNYGNMINCVNSCTIVGNGQIAGISGDNDGGSGIISQCINLGTIIVNEVEYTEDQGGITAINTGTVKLCINKGTIINNAKIGYDMGGIVGENRKNAIIENCYNIGEIRGNNINRVGGILGWNWSAITKNCYNIGNVKGAISYAGVVGDNATGYIGTVTNTYYLSGTCSTGIYNGTGEATEKTSEQLKSLSGTLGSEFKVDTNNINSGYPILSWQ